MDRNLKLTVKKKIEENEEGFGEFNTVSEVTTIGVFLEKIAPLFFLDKEDIEYIINRTPDMGPERWRYIIASLALFCECPKSKVPKMTDWLILQKLKENGGYCLPVKNLRRAKTSLRQRKIYPSYCPINEPHLVDTFCRERDLKIGNNVLEKAKEILSKIAKKGIARSHTPTVRIFTAIFIASHICKEPLTQRSLAEKGGISDKAISFTKRDIIEGLKLKINL